MQILGKRSKVLLIAVAIVMLVAIGVSFATWDVTAVKAASGNSSTYANAKVGDEIQFGNYYQSKTELTKKDPITWIVVDKDERIGQLTLMSKYILACGSYFGNWYDDGEGYDWKYNKILKDDGTFAYSTAEVGDLAFNQAYVDSTARAYLNNLERLDMGGDSFDAVNGYIPSGKNSVVSAELLSSVGFSNKRYWTGINTITAPNFGDIAGIYERPEELTNAQGVRYKEFYYQRPLDEPEYQSRPATKGFLDEAFSNAEKAMIVPKQIAGYTGHRWPDGTHDVSTKSYVEGAIDKVWLPSATELNLTSVQGGETNTSWINPSDEAGSTVFEYFKNLEGSTLANALKAIRTDLALDGKAGNYSIPVYDKGTTNIKEAISNLDDINSSDHYWTRSPMSSWFNRVLMVLGSGMSTNSGTHLSHVGVRPCVILKY